MTRSIEPARRKPPSPKLPSFEDAERLIGVFDALRSSAVMAREPSQDLLVQFDNAIAQTGALGSRLAAAAAPGSVLMVGSYLAECQDCYGGQSDGTTFGQLLARDVLSLSPPIGAVEMACRHWRQSSEFAPKISQMLEAIRLQKRRLDEAVEFMGSLPARRDRLARDLGKA